MSVDEAETRIGELEVRLAIVYQSHKYKVGDLKFHHGYSIYADVNISKLVK